ncbi:MAG: leucyl/phenylalanyl-tRNA--protein transferase [Spirochaetota bacterium]
MEAATSEGIVGVGGNLSPGMLLSAYRQGVFPWFNPGDPILWWSPDPRFVVFFEELHVSRSMRRTLRRGEFTLSMDESFADVIHGCATTPRPGQRGTWITGDMEEAYVRIHELGLAHSCEAWRDDVLVGGIYGVALGRVFFGESMFSRASNASKAALVTLCRFLDAHGFHFMDAQLHTPHVERMGGREIARPEFLRRLDRALALPTLRGSWGEAYARWREEAARTRDQ